MSPARTVLSAFRAPSDIFGKGDAGRLLWRGASRARESAIPPRPNCINSFLPVGEPRASLVRALLRQVPIQAPLRLVTPHLAVWWPPRARMLCDRPR